MMRQRSRSGIAVRPSDIWSIALSVSSNRSMLYLIGLGSHSWLSPNKKVQRSCGPRFLRVNTSGHNPLTLVVELNRFAWRGS